MFTTLYILLFVVCPVAAFLFLVRLVCSLVSSKITGQMRRHSAVHWVWGCLAFVGVLVFLGVLTPAVWPPRFVERRAQRQKLAERVQAAGGWAAIQSGCDSLVEQYRESGFHWHRWSTNALPPALAALKPWDIRFDSPELVRQATGRPQVAVVRIKVFGMHSTGGHSTPYFGLEAVSGPGAESYRPAPSRGGVSGNAYRSYRPLTNGIYEIY